jgi:hypothetical protein
MEFNMGDKVSNLSLDNAKVRKVYHSPELTSLGLIDSVVKGSNPPGGDAGGGTDSTGPS